MENEQIQAQAEEASREASRADATWQANTTSSSQTIRREQPKRISRAPAHLQDYVTGEHLTEEEEGDDQFLVLYTTADDPVSYDEAVKDIKWRQAMDAEIQAIEKNNTWELVELPKGMKKIGVKWVFKTKLNERGEVDKYKARLVVKGYEQRQGIDYSEVFSPVARWDTIRMILSLAALRSWEVFQLDVKSAFLHGELKEVVHIEQPEGYIRKGEEQKAYRLRKALYGLKQAPRAWYSRIEDYFNGEGFEKCSYEHTLFIKKEGGSFLVVSLYVDDLIFTGNDIKLCREFKASMQSVFDMTDLGRMKYFLGVEVHQTDAGIFLCQEKYAGELLTRFGMGSCNAVNNPMVPGTKLSSQEKGEEVNSTEYKQLIGSLMYITTTRPDIMYAVSFLSRFMAAPKEGHLLAAKRILRYLKGTIDFGVFYKKGSDNILKGYTDSDFAGDLDGGKSTSGYVFMIGDGAVAWSSRKQPIVTLSTTEAEYVAATTCACHSIWMKEVLNSVEEDYCKCITVFCDNSSSIKLSKNPVLHGRTKHINVRFHFIRDLIKKGEVELVYCGTKEQIADIMTKPLKLEDFVKLRMLLGVQEKKALN
ncbi:Retrovirus-related Pol polyprotein from transposon TNT 1-94 [Populus alba x Populus x berolinensis]|uniref:Retrovirus-related Pol polyprotein from transposon TNT 1-94 n=1 Tax=Populus alba x Populus x berolinensis TaxID=444605 RepID=A0AAD6QM68_9ROSI|nr:Retrovirus-related Pol polyprotein from transposon TNT 1-94 [Populus alba x Populus x berolinensis]